MTNLYEVRSFTFDNHGGNLAGVKLLSPHEELSTEEMQRIAATLGYSETAFVKPLKDNHFQVRYYTPLAEVPLCGHATIAAFSLLKQLAKLTAGTLMIETLAGNLGITISQDNMVFMEQTMPIFYDDQPNNQQVANSLGLVVTDFADDYLLKIVSTGLKDLIIPLKNSELLEKIRPDFKAINKISEELDIIGYHVFAFEDNQRPINCRNFAPYVGIDEEYATGTSNGALACYLFQETQATGDTTYEFKQGRLALDKTGQIFVKVTATERRLTQVLVGGKAVISRKLN